MLKTKIFPGATRKWQKLTMGSSIIEYYGRVPTPWWCKRYTSCITIFRRKASIPAIIRRIFPEYRVFRYEESYIIDPQNQTLTICSVNLLDGIKAIKTERYFPQSTQTGCSMEFEFEIQKDLGFFLNFLKSTAERTPVYEHYIIGRVLHLSVYTFLSYGFPFVIRGQNDEVHDTSF